MKDFFVKLFNLNIGTPNRGTVIEFFKKVSHRSEKEFLNKVIKDANQDQRDLVDQYDRRFSKTTK